jgi:hypothetical protein
LIRLLVHSIFHLLKIIFRPFTRTTLFIDKKKPLIAQRLLKQMFGV